MEINMSAKGTICLNCKKHKSKCTCAKDGKGAKFSYDKPDYTLIPLSALEGMVRVLEHGAMKYSKSLDITASYMLQYVEEELERCPNITKARSIILTHVNHVENLQLSMLLDYAKHAIDKSSRTERSVLSVENLCLPHPKDAETVIENTLTKDHMPDQNQSANSAGKGSHMHVDCVEPAMTKNSRKEIQNTQHVNDTTVVDGKKAIGTDLKNTKGKDLKIQSSKNEIKHEIENTDSKYVDSQNTQVIYYYRNNRTNAQSAEESLRRTSSILIMITTVDSQEVTYVVAATTVLECLEIILQVSKQQYNILKNVQLTSSSKDKYTLNILGRDNWKKVHNGEQEYTKALLRHIAAILDGEETDPDSGLPHWDHLMCNALFISWFRKQRGDSNEDNRTQF